jgi:hypothetical protein
MSQVIDLCEGSDNNGDWPNAASAPPLPLSRKRRRDDKEELSNDAHPRNENGPRNNKTATGWAKFVFDLEIADEVEVGVSSHRKRRSVTKSERSANNDAAGKIGQTLKEIHATEKGIGSEDAQDVDYDESHDGTFAAASYPMNLALEQTSRDATGKIGQTLKGFQSTEKGIGSEYAQDVDHDESHEGIAAATSYPMNLDLESTSRDDGSGDKHAQKRLTSKGTAWEDRLSELADYQKVHEHCNVPQKYSENVKLGTWVGNQRYQYSLFQKGATSTTTLPRIDALKRLGFEWEVRVGWEVRLSELANYQKVHGHCNVPREYSEYAKLGTWVARQRSQYSLHLKGKTSEMTLPRIQALERLGFGWSGRVTAREVRLSELADYRQVHGHCNVPQKYSENNKLGKWVALQRSQYSLYLKGKTSQITLPRIQALESLGFEWKPSISRRQGTTKKTNLEDDVTSARERAVESIGIKKSYGMKILSAVEKSATIKSTSLSIPKNRTGMAKSTSTFFHVEAQKEKPVDGGDSLSDETNLDGSPLKPSAEPYLYRDRHQAAKSLSPDNSAPASETALSNETLGTNLVAIAKPLQHRYNNLLGDGSTTRNSAQAKIDKLANAPQVIIQQTPHDEVFQLDNILHEELV